MYKFRLNLKRLSLWILLLTQILLITSYFYFQITANARDNHKIKISFLQETDVVQTNKITYQIIPGNIYLKLTATRQHYKDFNSSVCFSYGTNLQSMKNTKEFNWQCNCLPGWHGKDCGQPEVLWRAILAQRRPIKLKGPRIYERRIIYLFKIDKFSEYVAEIRLNELAEIVSLFILYENEDTDYLQRKLNNKFAKEFHKKILYIKGKLENLWESVKIYIKNLRNDDIIITSNSNEIPNKNALIFLKFYDGWSQPLKFRLRWSVYGFFWTHPAKTIITGGACTVSYLKDNFDDKLNLLIDNKTLSSPIFKGLILGDLNHYGGWFCEHCRDASQTVDYLSSKPKDVIDWDKIATKKIDQTFMEDVIENGLYIDGKTELRRAHQYSDNYFAPETVLKNNWKYDFLLINFYSKMDYYEG